MHPDTELRFINADIGFGVFAVRFLPEGTIVYVQDKLDISIDEEQYNSLDEQLKESVDRFAFIDQNGIRVLCWDHAKYVNHCCHANSISTGYGFEIAIRDIAADEQITDDYGLFNLVAPMEVKCSLSGCRKLVTKDDFDSYAPDWDRKIINSLKVVGKVPQPLLPYVDDAIREKVSSYIAGSSGYISVLDTRHRVDEACL